MSNIHLNISARKTAEYITRVAWILIVVDSRTITVMLMKLRGAFTIFKNVT